MEFLGFIVPFLAAGGWLWWIYHADRFEKEPWPLVLKTCGAGAAAGVIGLGAHVALPMLVPEGTSVALASVMVLVPIHLAGIGGVLYLMPFRTPAWNEPFDGIVYGGAAGIGYGLTYTLLLLFNSPLLGFRSAVFSIPIYMLAGLITGHYMSQVRFGHQKGSIAWTRALLFPALYLAGIELAQALGGEVMGRANPLASVVVFAANTIGWILAMWAMDAGNRASQFDAGNYRLWAADTGCPHCGLAHPVGAAFCNWCGRPVIEQKEAQG